MLTMVMVLGLFCVYAFLQLVQGFRKQGRIGLPVSWARAASKVFCSDVRS